MDRSYKSFVALLVSEVARLCAALESRIMELME